MSPPPVGGRLPVSGAMPLDNPDAGWSLRPGKVLPTIEEEGRLNIRRVGQVRRERRGAMTVPGPAYPTRS